MNARFETSSSVAPNRRMFIAMAATIVSPVKPASGGDADPVILSVRGLVKEHGGEYIDLRLSDLKALEPYKIRTRTPWDGDAVVYGGTRLSSIYDIVGAYGSALNMIALNDYKVVIPAVDLSEFEPIVAWERDGKLLPVADKGPLFVVYPFSDRPDLWNEEVFAKCIWQLRSVEVSD